MGHFTAEELREACVPIGSLIGKCEKARGKMRAGSWQARMLEGNLKALRLGMALMEGKDEKFGREELEEAVRTIGVMKGKTETMQKKFLRGSSQHTLLKNRLASLRVAEGVIRELKIFVNALCVRR